MDSLVLHSKAREKIERFVANPSHALLIAGAEGIGKSYVAHAVCGQILGLRPTNIQRHPFVKLVTSADSSLPIEAVRDLRHFLQLKTTGSGTLRRVSIVEHADTLTIEAQNALLKVLEEPPDDTLLILTANHSHGLLPTILSRAREVRLNPPEADQLLNFFGKSHSPEQVKHAFFLSGGLPGLMYSLLEQQSEHPLMSSVNNAKELLKQAQFERLAAVDTLSKQKEAAVMLIEALLRISRSGLHLAAQKQDNANLRRWHRLYRLSLQSGDSLSKNANTKLVLTNLILQM